MEFDGEENMVYMDYNDQAFHHTDMDINSEENVYYMDYTEQEQEQQEDNFNNFSVEHVDQIPENSADISIQLSNQENVMSREHETSKENEEADQPLYKLNNVDTESSVKAEIKQSIFTRIADETNWKVLKDTWFDLENQIESLKAQNDQLLIQNIDFQKKIDTDEIRLAQSMEVLNKTSEMIMLLKEDVNKLHLHQKETGVDEYLTASAQQKEQWQTQKQQYSFELKKAKEIIENIKTDSVSQNSDLKSDLNSKNETLVNLKKKQFELQQIVSTCIDDIQTHAKKKDLLVQSMNSINHNKGNIQNESEEQNNILKNIRNKKEALLLKFNNLNQVALKLEEEIGDLSRNLDQAEANVDNDKQIYEEQMRKNELEKQLQFTRQANEESYETLKDNLMNISNHLKEILSAIADSYKQNDELSKEMQHYSNLYIEKNEEKLIFTKETLELQNTVNNVKMQITQKETEHEMQRKKFEELQKEYEASGVLLGSLETEIAQEKENVDQELKQLKQKIILEESEINRCSLEILKKRDYVLANAKFLEEKSENFRKEMNENSNFVKNMETENSSIKLSIENKLSHLNELNQISAAKRSKELSLKSSFKIPNTAKKVKFNEIVSFKSATSSDNSIALVEDTIQLETSLNE